MKTKRYVWITLMTLLLLVWVWSRREQTKPALSLQQRVEEGLKALHAKADPKVTLTDMRQKLRQMDHAEALAWILEQLKTGEDFETGMDFTIGSGQNLTAWPSYRVFLLDLLYLVDAEAAARLSREILQSPRSADECAIAMRNVGRAGDVELLKTKVAELVRQKEWRAKPSAGYLEAFDVIVHTKHTAMAPELLTLCDVKDQKAVRHAAFLTLDRLIVAKPEVVLPELAQTAAKHPESGLMLSNMIARADVRDAVQRQALETYLLDQQRTAAELQGFASVFPNANMAVSENLLTHSATIDGSELAAKDRASLETVAKWLADPRFERVHDTLRQSYQRLKGFVER